ncbi:MAG: hypothetical protein C0506_06235 [Anaerolinea sp.]|nr:hypothetical protein [Anaerolinea sp.]
MATGDVAGGGETGRTNRTCVLIRLEGSLTMRLLCLYFPRLSTTLARRDHRVPRDLPLVLVSGEGDGALVAGASVEAAMAGVAIGMAAGAAKERCPAAAFLPDNANASLEALEQVASILRNRATPFVVIVSREHIAVSLAGLEGRFADEAAAADRLASVAREWSGLDLRAGVGDTMAEACEAARAARRCPVIAPATGAVAEPVAAYDESRRLSATLRFEGHEAAREVRGRLLKQLGRLQLMLDGREESARSLSLELGRRGGRETLVLLSAAPMHSAAEAAQLLASRTGDATFAGVTSLTVAFGRLGPRVRVERLAAPAAARGRAISAPVHPVQRRLLRAG